MPETFEVIISIVIMIAAVTLARMFHGWKIKRAYLQIISDLKAGGALDARTAVTLPYAHRGIFKLGLRDHRPVALKSLVRDNLVGLTEDGRYYLIDRTL